MTIGTIIKINVKKLGCKLNLAPFFKLTYMTRGFVHNKNAEINSALLLYSNLLKLFEKPF